MNQLASIVGFVGGECKGESREQDAWRDRPATSAEIKAKIKAHFEVILEFLDRSDDRRLFDEVERGLKSLLFALGRLFVAFFLALRQERSTNVVQSWLRRGYRQRKPERKYLGTFFGQVCFWRTYLRPPGGRGFHPLDLVLGLTADGFSLLALEICARLSTLVSYEQVTALLLYFLSWSPSKTTVEKAVLGLGHYTQEWFASAPPPEGDGEVLVIQFDSKRSEEHTSELQSRLHLVCRLLLEKKKRRACRRRRRSA